MRQGLAPVAMRGEPHGRPRVQPRPQRGSLEAQARAQQHGEQRVVAEPPLVAVDRRQEDPGAVEVGEHPPAVVALGQRVGELAADLFRDARAQQEAARLGRLQREDLAAQVVGDRVVVAGELGEEGLGVVLALERERREPQPRGPALGALHEPFGLVGAEREAVLGEQGIGLRRGEGQVRRAQLAQATFDAHPAQRQVGVGPRRHDQMERIAALGGNRADEQQRRAAQDVQVVEHEDRRAVGVVEGLADVAGGPVGERRRGARTAREVDPDLLQRRRQVAPQAGDVDVLGTQGEPSRAARGGPAGEQHRLPRARGPRHRGQRVTCLVVERVLEALALDGRERLPGHAAAKGVLGRRGEHRPHVARHAGKRVIPRGSASMALTGVSRGWRTPISGRVGTNLKMDDRGTGGCEGAPRQTRHRRRAPPPSVWRLHARPNCFSRNGIKNPSKNRRARPDMPKMHRGMPVDRFPGYRLSPVGKESPNLL